MVRAAVADGVAGPDVASPGMAPTPASFYEPADFERRIEDWVVCHLDDLDPQATAVDMVLHDMDLMAEAGLRRAAPRRDRRRQRPGSEDWTRFHIERRRDITVASLVDALLIKEELIQDLSRELSELIDAGDHRLVLDFGNVERLTSQIVGIVAAARRRCEAVDGGALKLCVPNPDLAEVFVLAGVGAPPEIFPDVKSARESVWPAYSGVRPLPVTILSALTTRRPKAVVLPAFAPVENAAPEAPAEGSLDVPDDEESDGAVWLIPEVGRQRGNLIPVRGEQFLIGRDPVCRIRSVSPTVSRAHAAIERRDEAVVLRDLGSTNGTLLNGHLFNGRAVALNTGDRIQIGPLVFTVAIGLDLMPSPSLDALVADWVADAPGGACPGAETIELAAGGSADDEDARGRAGRIQVRVSDGVLVVTPRMAHLDDDATLDPLRSGLCELFDRPVPKRVVLDMRHVAYISSRGIGVLLAHHLRLDRAGGALRLGEVHSRVRSTLDRVRLPMLLEAFATVEEAVLAAWP